MAGLVFPDEGSRLVFRVNTANAGLFGVPNTPVTIYEDPQARTLATIYDLSGKRIPGARIFVDRNSQIPLFRGPDGVDTLYARLGNGPVSPLYSRLDDRIDSVQRELKLKEPMIPRPPDRAGKALRFSDDGSTIVTYLPGTIGPPGPPGPKPDVSYVHEQQIPSSVWTVHHNLGYVPSSVLIRDTQGHTGEGEIQVVDSNTVVLRLAYAVAGTAFVS